MIAHVKDDCRMRRCPLKRASRRRAACRDARRRVQPALSDALDRRLLRRNQGRDSGGTGYQSRQKQAIGKLKLNSSGATIYGVMGRPQRSG